LSLKAIIKEIQSATEISDGLLDVLLNFLLFLSWSSKREEECKDGFRITDTSRIVDRRYTTFLMEEVI
jgi:hypothetical protein